MEHSNPQSDGVEVNIPQPRRVDPDRLERSHFWFGKTLGEGSYARVVHAKLKLDQSPQFALKIMEKDHIKKEGKIQYVMMEKKILSMIAHPLIIKLHYTFHDQEYLYMCMDLVPGGELLALIRKAQRDNEERGLHDRACDLSTTQFYVAEIIEALEYLHSRNIIHMDLKPENILISAEGHIKVGDFGTALMGLDEEAMKNLFVGTAEYVSPEVLDENDLITRSCDIWAVGCIAHQMLCGKTPFNAATEYLIFDRIKSHLNGSRPIEYPPSIQGDSRDLIDALLRTEPSARLGAGDLGSGCGFDSLKEHPFFAGIPWGAMLSAPAPFVPDPSTFPSADNMYDGALDEWMMDGDATPIMTESRRADLNGDLDETLRESLSFVEPWWQQFLRAGEQKVFTGLVSKRVGLFSKKRHLILTKTPRLIYVDPDTMQEKGEIFWSHDHPVSCVMKDHVTFDVICTRTGRAYHFTDLGGAGARMWIDLINALLEAQADTAS